MTDTTCGRPNPVFAPDGESIVLPTVAEGGLALRRIAVSGGAASTLTTFEEIPSFSGMSWSRDGIFSLRRGNGRDPARARKWRRAGTAGQRSGQGEIFHGPHCCRTAGRCSSRLRRNTGEDRWDKAQIVAQSLMDGTRRVLIRAAPTGDTFRPAICCTRLAEPCTRCRSMQRAEGHWRAVPVIAGVRRAAGGTDRRDATGRLGDWHHGVRPGAGHDALTARSLVLGDGSSDAVPLKVPPAVYAHPRVSPNGQVLAVGGTRVSRRTSGRTTFLEESSSSGSPLAERVASLCGLPTAGV